MDYFQGVVTEFLRADRAVFVNPECLIQLDIGKSPLKDRHWYCDVVAVNFRQSAVYLCEVTYSKTLSALLHRLRAWDTHWSAISAAIARDCAVPSTWRIQPWVFIPKKTHETQYSVKLGQFVVPRTAHGQMPLPRVTFLDDVTPWSYDWNRKDE
jgi:hypothetical protein